MLKDQLLKEAKEIKASVELDSIFESVELSEEVKQTFSDVFESTVKKHAVALAESHIEAIAAESDKLVTEAVEAQVTSIETKFLDRADKFFEHVATEWLAENKVQVERGIKADLFESMFTGIKSLVVEHDIVLPAESVDVVAEMEEELQEVKAETTKLFESLTATQAELNALKLSGLVEKATADLTESQQEKVHSLIEGLDYSDTFEKKLNAIVEMAKTTKLQKSTSKLVTENTEQERDINNITNDASGLNFVVESVETSVEKPTKVESPKINQYVAAAKRL